MNKEKIFEQMIDEMPYQFPKSIQPYVYEAMDIFAKYRASEFAIWCGENYVRLHGGWMHRFADQRVISNIRATSQLYAEFMAAEPTQIAQTID